MYYNLFDLKKLALNLIKPCVEQDLSKAIDYHENDLNVVIRLGEALDQVRFLEEKKFLQINFRTI